MKIVKIRHFATEPGCQEIISINLSNSKSPIISAHEKQNGKKIELNLIITTESQLNEYTNINETLSQSQQNSTRPQKEQLTDQIENLKKTDASFDMLL